MTSSLRERAATAETAPADGWPAAAKPGEARPASRMAQPEPEPERLEPVDAPDGIDADPQDVPVQVAIARLMRDLGKIGKADRFEGGNAGRYNFRGVDRVVNAVAPLQRKHGVIVVPELASVEYRDITRSGGGRSHECLVTMRYHWYGPRGDFITATVAGEALDTADKSTAKAQSVAWRVCLIQMLAIPTGDPDPDSVRIERGEQPQVRPSAYVDEICDPRTSLGRLKQIRAEITQHNIGGAMVTNESGDEEPLAQLLTRIGRERQSAGGAA